MDCPSGLFVISGRLDLFGLFIETHFLAGGTGTLGATEKLRVETIVSVPFQQNTYVAHLDGQTEAVVFDPGLEPDKILAYLDRENLTPAAILCTHGHSDHIGGVAALKKRWPDCPLVIGEADAAKLSDPWRNLSGMFGASLVCPQADQLVNEGDVFEAAGARFEVLDVPGHSAGHVVYLWRGEPIQVFSGDVVFQGSIGRTDFPDGDTELLIHGIHRKLFTLPNDTILWPGHGPPTTVGEEKRNNPFVGAPAGYRNFS